MTQGLRLSREECAGRHPKLVWFLPFSGLQIEPSNFVGVSFFETKIGPAKALEPHGATPQGLNLCIHKTPELIGEPS